MLPPWLWPEALINQVAYPLRGMLRWRRRGYREVPADVAAVIAGHPRRERLAALVERYAPALQGRHNAGNVIENLDVLHLLDRLFELAPWTPPARLRALDVGAKNFYYVAALHAAWSSRAPVDSLVGVEVDAYRVYRDGYSRHDYADTYRAGLAGTTFVAADIRDYHEPADVITLLFPFVMPLPLVRWGLPIGLLAPEAVLAHVWQLLAPGGLLLIVNQDEMEAAKQIALCEQLGIVPCGRSILTDPIIDDRPPRHLLAAIKPIVAAD